MQDGGRIRILDDSKVTADSITVNPYFNGVGWRPDKGKVTWSAPYEKYGDKPEYPKDFTYQTGSVSGTAPDRYWVNITDQHGNTASYLIDFSKAGSSVVTRYLFDTGTSVFSRNPNLVTGATGGFLITASYILKHRLVLNVESPTEETDFAEPAADPVRWYNNTALGNLSLPQGESSSIHDVVVGYGWEYIQQTNGDVRLEDIAAALGEESDDVMTTSYAVGDSDTSVTTGVAGPPDDPKLVFIQHVGQTILRVTAQELERRINTSREVEDAREFLHEEASETTRRMMTDGGMADDEYPSAILEAESHDGVSEQQVNDAVETIASLNNEEMAWNVVEETPGLAIQFFAKIDSSELRGFFTRADSPQQIARLIEALDGDAADVIAETRAGEYGNLMEMHDDELGILAEVVLDGELHGDDSLASDGITPTEIRKLSEETDLAEVELIAKDPDGRVVYLTPDRWKHIVDRHFEGTEINENANETTFFPSGESVTGGDGRLAANLPGTMNEHDVKHLIREAVERTQSSGGSYIVETTWSHHGISEMQINTDGNMITTAYPNNGPDVRRWNRVRERWERWNGNGWTRWSQPYDLQSEHSTILYLT